MTVTFGGTDLTLTIHDSPIMGQWDGEQVTHSFFGVRGEMIHGSPAHGRTIELTAHLTGYASQELLLTALNNLQNLRNTTAELIIDSMAPYQTATLVSAEQTESAWLDGSGVNGWQCGIKIMWRQSNNDQ